MAGIGEVITRVLLFKVAYAIHFGCLQYKFSFTFSLLIFLPLSNSLFFFFIALYGHEGRIIYYSKKEQNVENSIHMIRWPSLDMDGGSHITLGHTHTTFSELPSKPYPANAILFFFSTKALTHVSMRQPRRIGSHGVNSFH